MSLYDGLSAKIYLMEKHIKENGQKPEHQPWYLSADRRTETISHLKLGFYKILLALTRVGLIIRGKPASNFTVFTRAGKEGLYICNYSYCYYKDFHHKTRNQEQNNRHDNRCNNSLVLGDFFDFSGRAESQGRHI